MNCSLDADLSDPHYKSPGYFDALAHPDTNTDCTQFTETQLAPDKISSERNIVIGKSRKRKRSNDSGGEDNHILCWEAFQSYLAKCIPVKIKNNVASFRHVANGKEKEQVFPPLSSNLLPSDALDRSVTVQVVHDASSHDGLQAAGEARDNKIRQKAREIDRKVSMLSDTECIPTFLGQEGQLTTLMSLRDLTATDRYTHYVSASQLPILDVDELEDDSISLGVDGKLNHKATKNLELSPLASLLRLPSYLLLGEPKNESKDIAIQSINLWHAPQPCCTNVHYDEHDNLLIVTSGVKIVELCPPECIKASGVYSTHANHPELLRRCNEVDVDADIQSTLDRKRGRTHIVTVSSGEALYIPLGWWHRVVSKCNQGTTVESSGCTAINIWFDYHHSSRQNNIPNHMSVFHLRKCSRNYFELNKDDATTLLLQDKRAYFKENRTSALEELPSDVYFSSPDRVKCCQIWKKMHSIVFEEEELDNITITAFGRYFQECISTFYESTIEYRSQCHTILEAFLLQIRLQDPTQVAGLVQMLMELRPSGTLFRDMLCCLQPEACYVVTQAWEKHAGIKSFTDKNGDVHDEAEISYQCFFSSLEPHSNEVRNHLLYGVEEFYRRVWIRLSSAV